MPAQDPKQTNLVPTFLRLEPDIDERLDILSDHKGMKSHIMRTGIRKEVEYLESLRQTQQENKLAS